MPRLYFKNAVFPLTDECLCRDTKFENHIFPVFVNSVNQIENPQAMLYIISQIKTVELYSSMSGTPPNVK